jgi:hypothetical protein
MQPGILATTILKALMLIQGCCILVLLFAAIKIIQKRIHWQIRYLLALIVFPTALLISTWIYERNHRPKLLKQRISQHWTWTDGQQLHRLELNAYNRTFQHQLVGEDNTSQNQMIKGSTSVFKPEVDIITQETYYSLYLFDYPKAGYTTLISIDGASAPKISFSGKEVYELE